MGIRNLTIKYSLSSQEGPMCLDERHDKNVPERTKVLFVVQNNNIKGNNYNLQ